jgi:glycosyltransferase involved in cell wall biosynthesis
MRETSYRSLRLLVDLQACQTAGSGMRGVGRYSKALFSGLLSECCDHDIFAHMATHLPVALDLPGLQRPRILKTSALPPWATDRDFRGGEQDTLDSLLLSAFMAPLKADVIHVSHVFEGFGERLALPNAGQRATGQIISATLYDLIPLLFREHYFLNENFKKWYMARLAWLRKADLLLAISESSRQDAIALLGIEPWRIVTIHGGISSHFVPLDNRNAAKDDLAKRYNLRKRFVLYTGGDDHRKNINGAINGYAAVPRRLRADCQLVIVCDIGGERKQMYLNAARVAGLARDDVVITGFVPEEDLVAFYGCCDLFVFPSLYEGLGLPVLEAMACGAPVIGGDNSSIKELISRPDALFDAGSSEAIGGLIAKALVDPGYAGTLRDYGLVRAKDYTWRKTALLAIEAIDEAVRRSRKSGVRCAISGWLPRKRLAIFTPLPPCRSGIADYNARFLPHLARHFDIDLYVDDYKVVDDTLPSSFRIFNAKDFEGVANGYDAILYELGNSEFHAHMLPILERHPGIVGLHDAYLSGLYWYREFMLGQVGSYATEMLASHGPAARYYLAPVQKCANAIGETMVRLPCTKRVLDQAIGVISHSPFNLEIARSFYPHGWKAPYRVIPQMIAIPPAWSANQRARARKELGFREDDFIISTFGHIAWTKWGDRLLDAFLASGLRDNKKVHLVFAGELSLDDFGKKLGSAISKSNFGGRIKVTGYLPDDVYERYLRIADVAIQLRTSSRGGTPKGVLDCLAYGVPVVVNNDASYKDYPDDTVIKLAADPSVKEIALVLESISNDSGLRQTLSDSGIRYARLQHDPSSCAAAYAAAICEFSDRHKKTQADQAVLDLAPHLAGCNNQEDAIQFAFKWLQEVPRVAFERRRLIIDVSHIAQSDHKTGIQRVVKETVRALYCSVSLGIEPVAVELVDGKLQIARGWLQSQELLLPGELDQLAAGPPFEIIPGDVLLMLDSSWARFREFFPAFEIARSLKVPIYTAIYDLLPITLPEGNFVPGGREWFEGWFCDAVEASDGLICISQSIANEVNKYLDGMKALTKRPKVGYWHLGADFGDPGTTTSPSQPARDLAAHPYLLMVGTIEPRKSHALALSAMEILWDRGHQLCLCIVGKEGWMSGELMERLRQHPKIGDKLFLIEQPNDTDIDYLYANAAGLLFLSKGEGFGLPLIEAAHHGIPIICSDIPVFREISGDFATYVSDDDGALASELESWWRIRTAGQLPDTSLMPRLTWEKSGAMLVDVAINDNWIKDNK